MSDKANTSADADAVNAFILSFSSMFDDHQFYSPSQALTQATSHRWALSRQVLRFLFLIPTLPQIWEIATARVMAEFENGYLGRSSSISPASDATAPETYGRGRWY